MAVLYTELHARLLGPLLEAGEAVDRMGRVSVPISPGVPGEVIIQFRGGSEAYTAYTQAEEPLAVNTRVVVVQQPSSRTVLVTTS